MGGGKLFALGLAAVAAAAAGASSASGQCRLCDVPTTESEADSGTSQVTLEIETSLDFDRLILSGSGEGAALLRPDGSASAHGAIARWFGIGVKPVTSGSVLVLQSAVKLPVELAIEREKRAQRIRTARFDLSTLPRVRVPYRMWRAPALDFVVSAGVAYRASDGVRVDRQSSIYAAGEIARLSYDAQLSTDRKGMPSTVRLRAYRSDPDGGLLGPAKATHLGFGDVEGFDTRLTGSSAHGRGAVVTNRPLTAQTAFDRKRFEGDLPAGWEAEIYRNNELLGFAKSTADQRYVFDDVPLLYGENEIRVVLYGPQGQIRTREELIDVGQDNVPPGKTWYESSLADPMLVPKTALQLVVPRPGVPADVQIGLVGGGDVEGSLVKDSGLGFEGVDLELVDAGGKVVRTARTDYDGFFLFERVAYGRYTLRVSGQSAAAARIAAELGVRIEVTPDKSVVRLGAIRARSSALLASASGASP